MLPYYLKALPSWLPLIFSLFTAAIVIGAISRWLKITRFAGLRMPVAVFGLVLALVAGLWLAWHERSIFDDSFISFRYAENFLEGHGLVFNIGERVEGYTNFLWLMVVAALTWISGFEMPEVSVYANLVTFVATLVVVFLIGRRLSAAEKGQWYVPLATIWLATQYVFHVYGTSGMETLFAGLMVNLGVYFLITRQGNRQAFWSGLFMILAVFTRPDHALFYIFLALVFLVSYLWRIRQTYLQGEPLQPIIRSSVIAGLWYAAPFLLYAVYLIWKLHYYGSLVPNTFYAKSAELSNWSQGWIYLTSYVLDAHLWLLLPLFFIWIFTGTKKDPQPLFKMFAAVSVVLYTLYVVKIGGDYMLGRFFQTLAPLVLLGVEQIVHRLARAGEKRPAWIGIAAAALVLATLHGTYHVAGDKAGKRKFKVTEPNKNYRLETMHPLYIKQWNRALNRIGASQMLGEYLTDRGVKPVLAEGGIGMVGYYSRLPLIDTNGLTDAVVARMEIHHRGMPGHEKEPTRGYLDFRNVRLARRIKDPKALSNQYAGFSLAGKRMTRFRLYRYDKELLKEFDEKVPELHYTRFPKYFDHYYRQIFSKTPDKVAAALAEFDHYYFSLNDDEARRKKLTDRFIRVWDFEKGLPKGMKRSKPFRKPILRPVQAKDFNVDGYQGDALLASTVKGKGKIYLPPFTVTGDQIGFLLGGGKGKKASVYLEIDGKAVRSAHGNGDDQLRPVIWDTRRYKGKQAVIFLKDRSRNSRVLFDFFWEADRKAPLVKQAEPPTAKTES